MVLDPVVLKDAAMARTGLSAFGTAPLNEGLQSYCSALSREAALGDLGLAAVGESIIATLSQRLKVEQALSGNASDAVLRRSITGPCTIDFWTGFERLLDEMLPTPDLERPRV